METTCQASYPLNSEKASPPGTFKAYLSWADMALPPKPLTSAVTIAIVRMRWFFITSSSFVKLGAWLLESDATRRYTCRSIVPAVDPRAESPGWALRAPCKGAHRAERALSGRVFHEPVPEFP